jgi:hypothetical protein
VEDGRKLWTERRKAARRALGGVALVGWWGADRQHTASYYCKGKVTRASTTSMTNESSTSGLRGGLIACLGKLRDLVYVRVF